MNVTAVQRTSPHTGAAVLNTRRVKHHSPPPPPPTHILQLYTHPRADLDPRGLVPLESRRARLVYDSAQRGGTSSGFEPSESHIVQQLPIVRTAAFIDVAKEEGVDFAAEGRRA